MSQHVGKVMWFNKAKGFGFIALEGSPDVFVHYSALAMEGYKAVSDGDAVEFDIESGPGGKPQAAHVKKVG